MTETALVSGGKVGTGVDIGLESTDIDAARDTKSGEWDPRVEISKGLSRSIIMFQPQTTTGIQKGADQGPCGGIQEVEARTSQSGRCLIRQRFLQKRPYQPSRIGFDDPYLGHHSVVHGIGRHQTLPGLFLGQEPRKVKVLEEEGIASNHQDRGGRRKNGIQPKLNVRHRTQSGFVRCRAVVQDMVQRHLMTLGPRLEGAYACLIGDYINVVFFAESIRRQVIEPMSNEAIPSAKGKERFGDTEEMMMCGI